MKKFLVCLLLGLFCLAPVCLAQEDVSTIEGAVEEIAKDNSYIVVGGKKIITDEEFIEYNFLEIGDNISVVVEQGEKGPVGLYVDYIFEDEYLPDETDTQPLSMEAPETN